jgi:pimeloyl-ACP methyl ester carboxylesterase
MSTPSKRPFLNRLQSTANDVRGLSLLGRDAVLGVTDLVESLHHSISSLAPPLGAPRAGRTRGVTGMVYGAVRSTTRLVGAGLDSALGLLARDDGANDAEAEPRREAVLAAINGIWGDHLQTTANPLAVPLQFRWEGRALALTPAALTASLPEPKRRLVVLIHGLCMNDLQWSHNGHNHGLALAQDLDCSAVFVRYNSGRHISHNGRDLALALQALADAWPVPLEELVLLGHSMGGLVARSACAVAAQASMPWLGCLKHMVFLGTPHHGAPLEQSGQGLDLLLGLSPYLAPFARLGQSRSVGINDLRHGRVLDEDWQSPVSQARSHRDTRRPCPLPAGVDCFAVAAVLGSQTEAMAQRMIGDGLVPLRSALGQHRNPALSLGLPPSHQWVATKTNHWELLSSASVYQQLRQRLTPA